MAFKSILEPRCIIGSRRLFEMPHNASLFWSPDGTKILVGLPDGFLAFDPQTQTRTVVVVPDQIPFARLLAVVSPTT